MKMMRDHVIREMSVEEVAGIAVEWAAAEGWNPGLDDAVSFFNTDPGGFLGGFLGDIPVSCISAIDYNGTFGFIGFYIVAPGCRGRGCGRMIWEAGLKRLSGRNIGLDGVVEQQSNYRRAGFRLAYRNIRFAGVASRDPRPLPGIVPVGEISFNAILRYDAGLFPVPRARFLESWFSQPRAAAFATVEKGSLAGYTVVRKCRKGCKIGPLFAENGEAAEKLFLAASSWPEPGSPIFLDVPEVNHAALALVERHGMEKAFETARMYTGSFPDIDLGRVYGVTSFELG